MGEDVKKLMLATGKVVPDYRPLIRYLELANSEQRDRVLPKSSDIELVRTLLERGYETLEEVLNEIIQIVKERFDPDLSCRAIKEVLNIELEEDEAVRYLSKLLAGWIIEIAEQLGAIRLKGVW
ncbi:MAG: hypothetical protein J7L12_05385 [Desulfurococcales archaeon]|nr:hypothetical protein [Desulfurococcales archaeon]